MLLAGLIERVIARSRMRASQSPAPAARKMHMLIACADADRRPRITAALPAGDRADHAANADELWTMLSAGRYDMVVLDGASFRDQVGDLSTTMSRRFPDVPLVVLSKRLTLSEIQRLIQLQVQVVSSIIRSKRRRSLPR